MHKNSSSVVHALLFRLRGIGALLTVFIVGVSTALAQASHSTPQVRISLSQAERMAVAHNRTLQAERTLILQSKANQITASLRPNPVFEMDALFLPIFSPHALTTDNLNNFSEFDAGAKYTFELYGKRKARMKYARAATHVTSYRVSNDVRVLRYRVAEQFIGVLYAESKLRFARRDLATFDKSLAISEKQYKAGSISHGNLLKIKLERLQFQTDLEAARVEVVQVKNQLRQLVGFSALPRKYGVIGHLQAGKLHRSLLGLEAEALRMRPDLEAARRGVVEAQDRWRAAKAYAHPNLSTTFDYTHLSALNNLSAYASIAIPIFNRNQGEIARTSARITEAKDQKRAASEYVLTQVRSAYAQRRSALQVVSLYRSGYLKDASQSLSTSAYAYLRGDTSLLNFLDAERSYRTVELDYRRALAAAMLSRKLLQEVVGMPGQSGGSRQP